MPKNIVVCSDGTSNTKKTRTNVYQFFEALRKRDGNRCHYDKGVGSFSGDMLGKAFGVGVDANIRQAYEFVVEEYEPGDRIFLFGFSRGAFTVRSLASFIDLVGLVERNHRKIRVKNKQGPHVRYIKTQTAHTEQAYDVYRTSQQQAFERNLARAQAKLGLRDCRVHCIGVWDTVGAVGLPTRSRDPSAHLEHRYHVTSLSPRVRHAYHALALDDERQAFWANRFDCEAAPGQHVEEVWFAGMHSDVGGGYPVGSKGDGKAMSNVALRWMAKKMPAALGLSPADFPEGDALGPMHDSRSTSAEKKLYRCRVRRPPAGSRIHASVIDRIEGPIAPARVSPTREPGGRYRPASLVHRGGKADPDPFRPAWDAGPDFDLESRFEIVDRRYT